jgi:hypothetical protein
MGAVSGMLRNAWPQGNFMFDPANHRDFLGAILGTGDLGLRGSQMAQTCCWLGNTRTGDKEASRVHSLHNGCPLLPFGTPRLSHLAVGSSFLCALVSCCAATCTSLLPTGVVREKVGDILVQGERGAQVLVCPELVEHFEVRLQGGACQPHERI